MARTMKAAVVHEGKVKSHYSMDRLENVNAIFDRMREGKIDGRVVMAI